MENDGDELKDSEGRDKDEEGDDQRGKWGGG